MVRSIPSSSRRRAAALVVVALLTLAACGGDGGDDAAPDDTGVVQTSGADAATEGEPSPEADDPSNPTVLGYQLTGTPGTEVELEITPTTDAGEEPPFDQVRTLRDDPDFLIFSVFVNSATITAVVTTGGPATLEVFYGRAVDPDDPTLGAEILELLDTVEVGTDPVTVEIP